jgi:hypothetical protein
MSMNFRLLPCLIALIVLNPASHVFASMTVFMVDATNIKGMPFIVRTDTSGNAIYNKSINFTVIADPAGPPFAPGDYMQFSMQFSLGGASLTMYSSSNFMASNFVSSCTVDGQKISSSGLSGYLKDLKGPLARKGIVYEFSVSTNQLANADFEISYYSGLHPAINSYRFALQSFEPETSIGLVLGIKDNQLVITTVLPNTPAARAGLTPGWVVQQIDGTDSARYGGLASAQESFRPGIADLKLFDPSTGRTNDVLLTTTKTFP